MQDGKLGDLRTAESIFLTHPSVALHNSEPDHRGCGRRCRNAENQIPALHAGNPTRLQGRLRMERAAAFPDLEPGPSGMRDSNGRGNVSPACFISRNRSLVSCIPIRQRAAFFSPSPLPPAALSQHARRPAGSPLVTGVFPT